MTKIKLGSIAVASFLFTLPAHAQSIGVDLSDPDDAGLTFNNGAFTLGWGFDVIGKTIVSALGYWDEGGDGVAGENEVGLWDSFGSLLASVTVNNDSTAVTSVSGLGNWLFEPISPVIIDLGSYQVGAATNGTDLYRSTVGSIDLDPLLTNYQSNLFADGASLQFMTSQETEGVHNGLFGANLKVSASETNTTTIFLDFDTGVSGGFIKSDLLGFETQTPIYNPLADPFPSSNLDQSARDAIQAELERIFEDSNVAVQFTQNADDPRLFGDYYTVEFGADIDGGVAGVAYDVDSLANMTGVDRFDRRKNGTVAVFGDTPDIFNGEQYSLAEIAAHELGHAFGAFHINPDVTDAIVMDYNQALFDDPTFYNKPAGLVFKFEDSLGIDSEIGIPFSDHNPEYHLRRYLNGEDKKLLEQTLNPGNYDTQGFSVATLELSFLNMFDSLDSVYLGTGIFDANGAGSFNDLTFLKDITRLFEDGLFRFEATDFSDLSFFARSEGSEFIDLVLGSRDEFFLGQEFNMDDFINQEFSLFQYDRENSFFSKHSDIAVNTLNVYEVSPNTLAPVPLPATIWLFAAALGLMATMKKRSSVSA